MRRLKPNPDPWIELPARPFRSARAETGRWLDVPRVIGGVELIFRSVWTVLALPFRVVFGFFGLVGRLAALVVGFSMMVFGAALLPTPVWMIGIPLFAFGMLFSLRSLG